MMIATSIAVVAMTAGMATMASAQNTTAAACPLSRTEAAKALQGKAELARRDDGGTTLVTYDPAAFAIAPRPTRFTGIFVDGELSKLEIWVAGRDAAGMAQEVRRSLATGTVSCASTSCEWTPTSGSFNAPLNTLREVAISKTVLSDTELRLTCDYRFF